jgi:hypothetical protein
MSKSAGVFYITKEERMKGILAVLILGPTALAQTPAKNSEQSIFGWWTVDPAKGNSDWKAERHTVSRDGWVWAGITQKGEPIGAAMFLDKDGACHMVGFGDVTCKLTLKPKELTFTVATSNEGVFMEQHWVLAPDGKSVTQTYQPFEKGKAGTPVISRWMRWNPE